jgi:hypothetical protein
MQVNNEWIGVSDDDDGTEMLEQYVERGSCKGVKAGLGKRGKDWGGGEECALGNHCAV